MVFTSFKYVSLILSSIFKYELFGLFLLASFCPTEYGGLLIIILIFSFFSSSTFLFAIWKSSSSNNIFCLSCFSAVSNVSVKTSWVKGSNSPIILPYVSSILINEM